MKISDEELNRVSGGVAADLTGSQSKFNNDARRAKARRKYEQEIARIMSETGCTRGEAEARMAAKG